MAEGRQLKEYTGRSVHILGWAMQYFMNVWHISSFHEIKKMVSLHILWDPAHTIYDYIQVYQTINHF